MRINYSMIFVSDMKRSTAFYRDVLGLPLRFETSHWTEFATKGATLALHLAELPALPHPTTTEQPAGTCKAGFSVPNLKDFHQRMKAQNVTCLQEPKEVFGSTIAQYTDPDGLVLAISEERVL